MEIYGKTLTKQKKLSSWILTSIFCQWKRLPILSGINLCTPSKGINPSLPEKTVVAFPEKVVRQDNAYLPQNPSPPPLFASRPITTFNSQKTPKGKI